MGMSEASSQSRQPALGDDGIHQLHLMAQMPRHVQMPSHMSGRGQASISNELHL